MHPPSAEVAEITAHLREQLTAATFAKAREGHTHLKLRDRILNLPVMCAIVLSMVSRQFPSLSVVLRELKLKGLLWVESTTVSKEALSKRLAHMPSELFASLFGVTLLMARATPVSAATAPRAGPATAYVLLSSTGNPFKNSGVSYPVAKITRPARTRSRSSATSASRSWR